MFIQSNACLSKSLDTSLNVTMDLNNDFGLYNNTAALHRINLSNGETSYINHNDNEYTNESAHKHGITIFNIGLFNYK